MEIRLPEVLTLQFYRFFIKSTVQFYSFVLHSTEINKLICYL